MRMKRSTILNMWTLLHWLSVVSSPSSGISRLASRTSGVSQGSLNSAVVLKSNVCLRSRGAVEHPGRAHDGAYRNMRGVDASGWNAPIDELFVQTDRLGARRPARRGHASSAEREQHRGRIVTVGVGDGGNEIGMGNIRARFVKGGGLSARIGSTARGDHLVVAGVSNWGAYGIVAHLGRLAGRPLLHTPEDERRLVAACVAAGACDGVTRRR